MKILYHMLDTIATNAAYLHAVGTGLDLNSDYIKKTFRHSFISALAVQLTEPQMQISMRESTHWTKKYHEQIFQAEKEISDRYLSKQKRLEEERKAQAAQSSHSNPLGQCAYCSRENRVRVICDTCSKPVCGTHRIKLERNRYRCHKCNS